jgi:hypothetical protein
MPRSSCLLIPPGSSQTNQVGRCKGSRVIEIMNQSTRTRDEKSVYEHRRPCSPPRNEIFKSRERWNVGVVTHSEDNVAVSEEVLSISLGNGSIGVGRVLRGHCEIVMIVPGEESDKTVLRRTPQ